MSMTDLYQQQLLDYYRFPRNKGTLDNPDIDSGQVNPSCGDRVAVQGLMRDGHMVRMVFDGAGCVISLAAASLLSEFVVNKTVADILAFDEQTMRSLLGISLGPIRVKCATLSLLALQQGVAAYHEKISTQR